MELADFLLDYYVVYFGTSWVLLMLLYCLSLVEAINTCITDIYKPSESSSFFSPSEIVNSHFFFSFYWYMKMKKFASLFFHIVVVYYY